MFENVENVCFFYGRIGLMNESETVAEAEIEASTAICDMNERNENSANDQRVEKLINFASNVWPKGGFQSEIFMTHLPSVLTINRALKSVQPK